MSGGKAGYGQAGKELPLWLLLRRTEFGHAQPL